VKDVEYYEDLTPIDKKDWRAWVVLTKERDFGLRSRLDLEGNS